MQTHQVVAAGHLGVLVSLEMKQGAIQDADVAQRARERLGMVHRSIAGKSLPIDEDELKELANELFQAEVARKARVGLEVVRKAMTGEVRAAREYELKRLINVLFRSKTKRRRRAHRLASRAFGKSFSVVVPPYNNRSKVCRGKLR